MLTSLTFWCATCRSTASAPPPKEEDPFALQGDDYEESSGGSDEYVEENSAEENDNGIKKTKRPRFPHPPKPNAANTKVLVMTSKLPAQDDMEGCRRDLEVIATNSTNSDTLLQNMSKVSDLVAGDLHLYHWCFYYSIVVLDNKLESDGLGVLVEEQTMNFSRSIKAMWILANALDRSLAGRRYFDYLRRRYVQMNHDYFGRDVMILSSPFQAPKLELLMDKEAGAFEDY